MHSNLLGWIPIDVLLRLGEDEINVLAPKGLATGKEREHGPMYHGGVTLECDEVKGR